jgi:hypothetical protein
MLSGAHRDTLVALKDQIQAQTLQLTDRRAGEQALALAQQRLAQHPTERLQITGAMRYAPPGVTLVNVDDGLLETLLAYQPPAPLI